MPGVEAGPGFPLTEGACSLTTEVPLPGERKRGRSHWLFLPVSIGELKMY
jgi:hypothetical protein